MEQLVYCLSSIEYIIIWPHLERWRIWFRYPWGDRPIESGHWGDGCPWKGSSR